MSADHSRATLGRYGLIVAIAGLFVTVALAAGAGAIQWGRVDARLSNIETTVNRVDQQLQRHGETTRAEVSDLDRRVSRIEGRQPPTP